MDWKKLLSEERIRKSKPVSGDIRNAYESDFGRIIFSPALRRMHDKTQVFPLTTDDNIHSRLTHSNEVMSIGYTFGLKLCEEEIFKTKTGKSQLELLRIFPVVLKNVCLIHDIGNAPFGHFGETIVSNYFKNLDETKSCEAFNTLNEHQKRDFINYDGNAQGLRVLTRLQILDDAYGLNLTYATLASYLKYPNFDEINDNVEKKLSDAGNSLELHTIEKSKHGVFASEKEFFKKIMETCGLEINNKYLRHPLCYLMEASDSIAYLTMDIEDGYHKNLVSFKDIKEKFSDLANLKTDEYPDGLPVAVYILKMCDDDYINDTTKIVNIRIALINYLVNFTFKRFMDKLSEIETGSYNKELLKDDPNKVAKILADICFKKIFSSREINYLETAGYSVFTGLLDYYIAFIFHKEKKFRRRAESLISKSIINCAIEENLINIFESKLSNELEKLEKNKTKYKKNETKLTEIGKDIEKIKKLKTEADKLLNEFKLLSIKQEEEPLNEKEKEEFPVLKKKLKKIIDPCFDDLEDYSKFRVILDFISGMTDQYALNHFQKISGQKIF